MIGLGLRGVLEIAAAATTATAAATGLAGTGPVQRDGWTNGHRDHATCKRKYIRFHIQYLQASRAGITLTI